MKLLVANRPTPPRRYGDVWSAIHGEIVVAPYVCPDTACDCGRVHQGVVSHGYSTEVEVRDIDTSSQALTMACRSHLGFSQWAAMVEHPSGLDSLARDLVADMSEIAERYPDGTVLRMEFDQRAGDWRYAIA